MTDKELIKLLRVALSIAAIEARENAPAHVSENMDMEDFIQLYTDVDNDIFGERFIAQWLNKAKEALNID